jgi:RNA polymerase sigma factor (sigma-70 family)
LADGCLGGHTAPELRLVAEDGATAWQTFYEANLRMALRIAHSWARKFEIDAEEVFQECCVGLGEAIMCWDWSRGTRFSTVGWKIITNYARKSCLLRCGQLDGPYWIMRTKRTLRREVELQPGGVLDVGNRSQAWVEKILDWTAPASVPDMGALCEAASLLGSAAGWGAGTVSEQLAGCLFRLSDRDRMVLSSRFALDGTKKSYQQLSTLLNVPVREVKELEEYALHQLRTVIEETGE